jgi:tRNA (guanine37-N1)-methyltransferase
MIIEVLTLFPEMVDAYLGSAMMKRAAAAGAVGFHVTNIRDFALDKHKVADDSPFGGGPGMVMKPEPVAAAIMAAKKRLQGTDAGDNVPRQDGRESMGTDAPVVYLSPQGEKWNQALAEEFAALPGFILLCGRYEGLDERVIEKHVDREISIGDYVLTGGELGALVMIDSVTRLLPGVLGNAESAPQDSFSHDGLLDCPHYTRPEVWEEMRVPDVLMSGHHAKIEAWRRLMSLTRTRERRPDIFAQVEANLTKKDRKMLAQYDAERGEGRAEE